MVWDAEVPVAASRVHTVNGFSPHNQLAPNPNPYPGVYKLSQSELEKFRAMPIVITSTMNLSFAKPFIKNVSQQQEKRAKFSHMTQTRRVRLAC
jgi:hypothetical protein